MYIIDKNQDFYDYLSHVYGVDKKIVFDRKGSTILTDDDLEPYSDRWRKDNESYLILEMGYTQVVLRQYNYTYYWDFWETCHIRCDMEKVRYFKNCKNLFGCPLSLYRVELSYRYYGKDFMVITNANSLSELDYQKKKITDFPILKNTVITKYVDAVEIWMEIQNYISSLNNDPYVDIGSTDVERAANHGFDKNSFRHPIK